MATVDRPHRLVILSGPSCAGKSPLVRAVARLYPELWRGLEPLVLYNSRDPRPGEVDGVHYHFRPRALLEGLRADERHAVLDVRGDLQALELPGLSRLLGQRDVLFEGNPFVGRLLQTHPRLREVPRLSVFLAPLSRAELEWLGGPGRAVDLPSLVTDVMRRKLLRRTRRQKGELSLGDLEQVERRAGSAYRELTEAQHFDHVIANHDGEDSENWEAFYYPLGDARRAVEAFVALLAGRPAEGVERWPAELLP